jgi:hypothetical protein
MPPTKPLLPVPMSASSRLLFCGGGGFFGAADGGNLGAEVGDDGVLLAVESPDKLVVLA